MRILALDHGSKRIGVAVSEINSETAIETENRVRSAILAGVDPQEAYLKHGKF